MPDPRTIFTPDRPVSDAQLFAGRMKELQRLVDLVTSPRGKQVALVGERGIGKTSLVKVATAVAAQSVPLVVRVSCDANGRFPALWRQAFSRVTLLEPRTAVGFDSARVQETISLAQRCPEEPGPGEVLSLLAGIRVPCLFAFDEFDRLSPTSTLPFSDLIKGLTDEDVPASILFVGVAENVTDLFDSHASVERSLSTILLPRMRLSEIAEIPRKGAAKLGLAFDDDAVDYIAYLARGFPHIAHLLSLHATERVLRERRSNVQGDDVWEAQQTAVQEADPVLQDRYHEAVDSPRKDAQFRHLLAACAVVPKDIHGYFRPGDLLNAMSSIIGKACEVSSYTGKLNDLCDGRGRSLTRRGVPRKHKYRFTNPMMESYVIVKSLVDRLIDRGLFTRIRAQGNDNDDE